MALEQLIERENELLKLLEENREAQRCLAVAEFTERYGIEVGDDISLKENGVKGKVLKLIGARGVKGVEVQLFKKDGTLGRNTRRVWGWNFNDLKKI